MAITFQFWFSSLEHFVPIAMYCAFRIAFSAFLIASSRDKGRETLHKNLMLLAAIINIVSTVLLFFFPIGSRAYSPTVEEEALRNLFIIIGSLITYIPSIISFGLVFFIYGYKNRRQIGNYLMYSGVFWLIFTKWASISLFSPFNNTPQLPMIIDLIFNLPSSLVYVISFQILAIGSWFSVLANFFLLIHAFLTKDRMLKIAGLIYFIWHATIGLSFIPLYFSIYL